MYSILSILIGCIIAGMVAVNGALTSQYGIFGATVIIHIVGSAFAFVALKLFGQKIKLHRGIPLWMYLGGVIGVFTTLFNNLAFGKISMTSIVALGLFGQTLLSLLTDWLGLFGLQKRPFASYKLIGLTFAAAGMGIMLDSTEQAALLAVIVSLLAGVTVALSRMVNAGLSGHIGAGQGALINHVTGLPVTVLILLLFGRSEPIFTNFALSPRLWLYTGGMLGFLVVMLFNVAVPNIPAINLTLLTFVGQVFTGVLIDLATTSSYSARTFYGGLLVAAGIFVNILLEYIRKRRAEAGGPPGNKAA